MPLAMMLVLFMLLASLLGVNVGTVPVVSYWPMSTYCLPAAPP